MRRQALCAAVLLAGTALAQETVAVLSVRNRPAEDLVAVLQPLAGPEGTVTSFEGRLIVRARPDALRQIQAALLELDVAPRALWISVRHATAAASRSLQAAGRVVVGGQRAPSGTSVHVSPDGTTVTTRRSRSVVVGSAGATSEQETGSDVQRLAALEGRPAFIEVGRAEPAPVVPAAGVLAPAYIEAGSGFWVLPRLAGEIVTLDIAASKDAFTGGAALATRHVRTTLSGRLGEWLHVGGVASSEQSNERAPLAGASSRSASDWSVDLKVEAGP